MRWRRPPSHLRASTVADFCDQNADLWFDAFGDLIGFVVSASGDASLAILLADGYRFLFQELLRWALDAWGDREGTPQVGSPIDPGIIGPGRVRSLGR